MKLIYLTSKTYPSKKVDPYFHQRMAEAFSRILGEDFLFFMRGKVPGEFSDMRTMSVDLPTHFRIPAYFVLLPFLIARHGWSNPETVFFSYDPNLLSILVFWRKMVRFRYRICSEWHQLYDDWRDAFVARNSDLVVCTSNKLRDQLIERCGADPEVTHVAYGGIDLRPFVTARKKDRKDLRRGSALPKETFLVAYIGGFRSLGMLKGTDILIRALPLLPNDIMAVFVGGSPEDNHDHQELAEKLGVGGRCLFIQKQLFEKVVEYEVSMDVLTIPYPDKHHFRNYGFPLKVWEYMAAGRPIVYSDLEIIDEVLNGKGLSFKAGDERDLAKTIAAVYNDKERHEAIAEKNTEFVQNYTWNKRAEYILKLMEEICVQ